MDRTELIWRVSETGMGKTKNQMRFIHEQGSERMTFGREKTSLNCELSTLFQITG